MDKNQLVADCLREIDAIYQKYADALDNSQSALQLQLDRAYSKIYATEEAKAICLKILYEAEISDIILEYIDKKNSELLNLN